MAEDPIRKYSDATAELNSSYSKIRSLGEIIADVGWSLRNKPYGLMVSNLKPNLKVGFPPEVALREGVPSLNANNWPSAQDIAQALSDLRKARHQVDNLWGSLSATDKQLVSPPPEKW